MPIEVRSTVLQASAPASRVAARWKLTPSRLQWTPAASTPIAELGLLNELALALEMASRPEPWLFRPSAWSFRTETRPKAEPVEVMVGTVTELMQDQAVLWLEDESGEGREIQLPRSMIGLSVEPGDLLQVLFFSEDGAISAKFQKAPTPGQAELQRSLADLKSRCGSD